MQDFKVMFPEMDTDVIEAVLRSNSGAVDATIDALLTMSTDNEVILCFFFGKSDSRLVIFRMSN